MKNENGPGIVKDTFVMYRSYLKQLELLSLEDRGIWITAVLNYVSGLSLPEMPQAVALAFSIAKERIDEDYAKWQRTVASKREAGYRGGIASGISRRAKSEASASSASKNEANEHDNVYVNEYDNDTVYVNNHNSYIHDRKQTAKEARRGIERDVDLDAIVLEKIRNRGSGSLSDGPGSVPADLGVTIPDESRWSVC